MVDPGLGTISTVNRNFVSKLCLYSSVQKPYACTVPGCSKRYTDPSSLRKHQKQHNQNAVDQSRKKVGYLCSCSSIYLYVLIFIICFSIYMFFHLYVLLFICSSIYMFFYLYVLLFSPICSSIYVFLYFYVLLFICSYIYIRSSNFIFSILIRYFFLS